MNIITYCSETNTLHFLSETGTVIEHTIIEDDSSENFIKPVVCNHCNKIYDLANVKVNHRFQDCSQFTTPCCNYNFADDREWKSFPDYIPLDRYLQSF